MIELRQWGFYSDKDQKPSSYNMEISFDAKKTGILTEFQTFLLNKKIVMEKNVFF
jgi:hypothetical protein